jgi:hypothetical protein
MECAATAGALAFRWHIVVLQPGRRRNNAVASAKPNSHGTPIALPPPWDGGGVTVPTSSTVRVKGVAEAPWRIVSVNGTDAPARSSDLNVTATRHESPG